MKISFGKIIPFIILMTVLLFGFVNMGFAQDISGDIRLRHDIQNLDGKTQEDRNTVRARIRVSGDLNGTTNYGIGLTTKNQSLSGVTNESIDFDLAYIGWNINNNTYICGGKINNPLYRVGDNELLWKDTFNPEGFGLNMDITEKGEKSILPITSLFMNGSYFILNENPTGEDYKLIGGQAGIVIGDNLMVGAGHYYYSLLEMSFYEYFVEMETELVGMPGMIYGNYIKDGGAESWLTGIEVTPGFFTLETYVFYNYCNINYDVVNYGFSDPDYATFVGIDGGEGHKFGIGVDLMNNIEAKVTYFTDDGFDENKAQADLIVNF